MRAYRNAMLEAPTTEWIATAHAVDEAVETSDIFAEFGDMPQFTLHSLDVTVEVMRTSACAALLPARYAERFAHLDVMEHIPARLGLLSLPAKPIRSSKMRWIGLSRAFTDCSNQSSANFSRI